MMWALKLPPKVKNFAWRALSGCLPTKDNLLMRRVEVISVCPVCNNEPETIYHSLVTCHFAALCWNYAGLMTNDLQGTSNLQWLTLAFDRYSKKEAQRIIMVCWGI